MRTIDKMPLTLANRPNTVSWLMWRFGVHETEISIVASNNGEVVNIFMNTTITWRGRTVNIGSLYRQFIVPRPLTITEVKIQPPTGVTAVQTDEPPPVDHGQVRSRKMYTESTPTGLKTVTMRDIAGPVPCTVQQVADAIAPACKNHPDRPMRAKLDGDYLCQECCDEWTVGERS